MRNLSARLEPQIAFGAGPSEGSVAPELRVDAPVARRDAAPDNLAVATLGLVSAIGDTVDEAALIRKFDRLFDFAPIVPQTMHPVLFAGGSTRARRKALRALAARLGRHGRATRLYSLQPLGAVEPANRWDDVSAIEHVQSAAALLRLLREPAFDDALALIDTPLPLDCDGTVGMLGHLAEAAHVETVLFADDSALVPAESLESLRINRFVLGGRIDGRMLETVLELGYRRAWAFAGWSQMAGVFRNVEAAGLADRVMAALLSGGFIDRPVPAAIAASEMIAGGLPAIGGAAR